VSLTIASLMQRQVRTVGIDDTVERVEQILVENGLSWAPVVQPGGTVAGVISAADLLQFHAIQRDAANTRAWQLCHYLPLSVASTTPIGEVARMMVQRHIHHVVVIDGNALAGVVSSLDFVRTFADPA
jgi:CBS domain-containing protein